MKARGSADTVQDEVLKRLRESIEGALREQTLILARDYWVKNRENNSGLLKPFDLLDAATTEQVAALELIRAVNSATHDGKRTHGAAKLLPLVAKSQGGFYCRMCGEQHPLHVDHIRPTSKAGTDHISNLQLLCSPCNLGKGATEFGNLPSILRVRTDESVDAGLRFLRLSLRAIESAGRPLGRCDCGQLASEKRLFVSCRQSLAANLTNLRVTCEACDG
ncbi:hypothetical protein BST16_09240 [Mycobacterium asiaticum DSM 44297]|nr:hypothetical protein BST16_09240 [Mycobacterium asiaticum DSM 44297]